MMTCMTIYSEVLAGASACIVSLYHHLPTSSDKGEHVVVSHESKKSSCSGLFLSDCVIRQAGDSEQTQRGFNHWLFASHCGHNTRRR